MRGGEAHRHDDSMTSEHREGVDVAQAHTGNPPPTAARGDEKDSLRRSEERYRLIVEQGADDFFMHDDEGRFLEVNRRACTNTGYSREELLRMSVLDIATDVTREHAQRIWDSTQPGASSTAYAHHQRKDGSRFPVEVRISCQMVDGRKLFLGMARDISERVEAERSIHELNSQLRRLLAETAEESRKTANLLQAVIDAAPDLVYVKDRNGRYLYVNKADEKLKGLPIAEILGRDDTAIFPIDFARELMANDRRVMDRGVAYELEEEPVLDGVLRTYLSNKAPYRDEKGEVIGLIGISRDVTAMKHAEAALRRSEARWQFALDGSGDGIWDWDLQTGTVFYSRQWKAMLGYAEDEIGTGVNEWSDRVHPDDLPRCREVVNAHLRGDSPDFALEHRMRAKSGAWRWIFDRGKTIERDAEGKSLRVVGTHTDITVRKEGEDAIRELNQRLQLANRVSGVGVWELPDPSGRFFWDGQMHAVYGLEPGSFDGSLGQWILMLHPDDAERVLEQWNAALTDVSAPFFHSEFRIVRPDGELRHMRAQAQMFRTADGSVQRVLGVNWDITASRVAADTMQRAKEAAEAAERAKSEFLAVMSHEIRTPMNTVLGMTRLALQTDLAPRQRNYLEKVNVSAQTLITIINNILDFSKIEARRLELEEAEFTLESMLESVSAVTAMKAEEKGLEIVYSIAPGVPTRLIGDSLRLGQVLINLVNNAIKFTARGEVVVSICTLGQDGSDHTALQFSVSDTGIGLDAGQIAGLFRAFSQADSHVSRRYGGTGLGLAICKQIVELMGGRIGVTSEPGKGSTFQFTVEIRRPAMKHGVTTPPTQLAGQRVLVVDDNAAARDILSQMLLGFGMDVAVADSGMATLHLLKQADLEQRPFRLVLLDWQMPGMDGLETAQQMRVTPELRQMPAVLMVTAYGREEVLRRAEHLGLHGVLIKPVTKSTMFETITNVIGIDHADTQTASVPTAAATRQSLEALAGTGILIVDANMLNCEVASDFLLGAGMLVETATNGLDALARLNRADYDAVLMDIHMPDMDGFAAAREIRKQARWARLPVIALTARASPEDRESSAQAGMNAHLTKPIDETVLYETLLRLLASAAAADTASAAAPGECTSDTADLPAASKHLNLVAALEHLGNRRELLLRMLRGFAQDFAATPQLLAEDLRNGRSETIAAQAHAVKGAASYLHADELRACAERLEIAARRDGPDAIGHLQARFVQELEAVLRELAGILSRHPATPAIRQAGEVAAVLRLLDAAEPLVASGDYGAQSRFAQIDACVAGTPLAPLAETMRMHFERLELDEARLALRQLRLACRRTIAGNAVA